MSHLHYYLPTWYSKRNIHLKSIKYTLVRLKPRDVSYDLCSRQLLCVAQTVRCTFNSTKISLRLISHRAIIKGVWGSGWKPSHSDLVVWRRRDFRLIPQPLFLSFLESEANRRLIKQYVIQTRGEMEVQLQTLTSALDGAECSTSHQHLLYSLRKGPL